MNKSDPRPARLSRPQAAKYLGISTLTLIRLEQRGEGPSAYRIGERNTYAAGDLDAWLDAHRVTPDQQRRALEVSPAVMPSASTRCRTTQTTSDEEHAASGGTDDDFREILADECAARERAGKRGA